ncbi:MAG: hypothetical protein KIT14_07045 [bacterium]|nr:hypothetical protein [bacterium]
MIRLVCILTLVALGALVLLVLREDGGSAIVFSFVGCPALAAAMGLYALHRLRSGAPPPLR